MEQEIPMKNELLKDAVGDGKIEFCLYNPRNKSGIQTWELKVLNTDGTRKETKLN